MGGVCVVTSVRIPPGLPPLVTFAPVSVSRAPRFPRTRSFAPGRFRPGRGSSCTSMLVTRRDRALFTCSTWPAASIWGRSDTILRTVAGRMGPIAVAYGLSLLLTCASDARHQPALGGSGGTCHCARGRFRVYWMQCPLGHTSLEGRIFGVRDVRRPISVAAMLSERRPADGQRHRQVVQGREGLRLHRD